MRDYRDKASGLADLINYACMVDEGILLLKDGAFCAGWYYRGPDMHSVSDNDLIHLRLTLNQALGNLGDGWMLHCDLVRREIRDYVEEQDNHFVNVTSLFIDHERRQNFTKANTHFLSDTYFILTYKPPVEVEATFTSFFIERSTSEEPGWNEVLILFKKKLEQIESSLSKALSLTCLQSSELLTHLHTCMTGKHHTIALPTFFVYLDQLLASQDFVGGFSPKIGKKHIAVLSINGYPLESFPSMLQNLSELPITFRWCNRFIFLDKSSEIQELKKHRRYWFQKRQGLSGLIRDIFNAQSATFLDQDALEMANDSDQAIQETESNLVHHGFYTSVIIVMDEDPTQLENAIKILTKELEKKGFATRLETVNAVEAYLGSLPGHGYQNIRRPLVSTHNLADFLPLLSVWSGHPFHPSPYYPKKSPPLFYAHTQGNTPFRCSLHVEDVGHTLAFGDTGSGKSTLLGFMLAQHLRYKAAQVFMFDKGYSSFTLCHALGGNHYDIASMQEQVSFAPLQSIHQESELDWVCGWLEILYQAQGILLEPLQRKEIRECLQRLSAQPSKTLTDLQASLCDKALKAGIEFYTLSGAMGQLLDAEQDAMKSSHLSVFEMTHLLNKEERFVLPILHYLFHQIDKRLDVNKPTLIIIEEGHRFLMGNFGKQLETWLRECRKHNAAVIFVTQGIAEIINSPSQHILLNSCPTKIFLPNINASSAYNKALYYQIGLSDKEIDLIKNSIPKQDYYLVSSQGNKLMNLSLSKGFLALMDSTNTEARNFILTLINQHKKEWIYHYLLDKGLSAQARQWLEIYQKNKNRRVV